MVIAEVVHRYRTNRDGSERRRIRMAVYTAVPGVVAYAVKDGVPIFARLAGLEAPVYHGSTIIGLQALVLMPAFDREDAFQSVTFRMANPAGFAALKKRLESDPRLGVQVKTERAFYSDGRRCSAP